MLRDKAKNVHPVPLKLVLCFDGTYGTLDDKNNSIVNIFEQCSSDKDTEKYYFAGPGTDSSDPLPKDAYQITNAVRKGIRAAKSNLGGLAGSHVGAHSVSANLTAALSIIKDKIFVAQQNKKPLQIFLFGWSRGGYTTLLLLKEIKNLIQKMKKENKINQNIDEDEILAGIYMDNIDPVPGGPTDRYYLSYYSAMQNPVVPITYKSRLSDTGDMKSYQDNRPARFADWNMPFFSALADSRLGTHERATKQFKLPLTHGAIASIGDDKAQDITLKFSRVVFADMVLTAIKHGLQFDSDWADKVIKEGFRCLMECEAYLKQNPAKTNRGVLSFDKPYLPTQIQNLSLNEFHEMELYQAYQKKLKTDEREKLLTEVLQSFDVQAIPPEAFLSEIKKLSEEIQNDIDTLKLEKDQLHLELTKLEEDRLYLKNKQNSLNDESIIAYDEKLANLIGLTAEQRENWKEARRNAESLVKDATTRWGSTAYSALSYVYSCIFTPKAEQVKQFLQNGISNALTKCLSEKNHIDYRLTEIESDISSAQQFLDRIKKESDKKIQNRNQQIIYSNERKILALHGKIMDEKFDSVFLWGRGKTIPGKTNGKVPNHVYILFNILNNYIISTDEHSLEEQNKLIRNIETHVNQYLTAVQGQSAIFKFHRSQSIHFHTRVSQMLKETEQEIVEQQLLHSRSIS